MSLHPDDADIDAILAEALESQSVSVAAAPEPASSPASTSVPTTPPTIAPVATVTRPSAPIRSRPAAAPLPEIVDTDVGQLHDLDPEVYFALPRFSSSRAKVLIDRSPAHARAMREKRPGKELDFGSVGHRLVLGKGKDYAVLDFDSYNTKLAKAKRDGARAKGLVPILLEDFERACVAAESVRVQFADRGILLDGLNEAVLTWCEPTRHGDISCKAMLDHVWIDEGVILDLKFTEDASPEAIERNAENLNYALQSAAYTRALTRLRPELAGRVRFLFAFIEKEEPYALNLVEPDGMFKELGERRWERAVETWASCVATNTWPAYGSGVNRISPPPWALRREEHAA